MSEDPTDLRSTELLPTDSSTSGSTTEPESIGPYRLLEKLGEGGMGEVWLAEQTEPVRRRVALKVIKQGMDTKRVVARFEAERQALALMDHPTVARVFDAGATPTGTPYFAMEYVKGVPISEHCDRHKLDTRQRLELFVRVCEGVQHAHQKAIIHRDLKPTNVLVSIRDDHAAPKIIDFGVAKAIDHRLTEQTVYTELGTLIGTPEYMSPEQAEMTGQDVDTRTDVYSLGVMLYELLVGTLPFDSAELRQAGFDGIRRKIREEDPPKPSTRLSTMEKPRSVESAQSRRTDPPGLARELRGDLDWIAMKALEKDRTRRYGSPAELAADLQRYLSHEPVSASPPTARYRAGKFVRRHRLGVAFGAFALLALVAFAVTMTLQTRRIARESVKAEAKHLLAMSRLQMVDDPSAAVAYTIASLELADDLETRRVVVEALWKGPIRFQLPTAQGWGVSFSPDGNWLAGGNSERVWTLDGTAVVLESFPTEPTMGLNFDPLSSHVAMAVGTGRNRIGIWSIPAGRLERMVELETDTAFWFRGSSPVRLVTASLDRRNWGESLWQEWPLDSGAATMLGRLSRARGSGWVSPEIDPAGEWLAYADDHEVRLVRFDDLGSTGSTLVGRHDESVSALTVHPDGDRIASVGRSGEIRIWSRSSGPERPLRVLDGEIDVIMLQFGPEGRQLVTAGIGAEVWDLSAPADTAPVVLDSRPVDKPAVSFHPSGRWVAAVGDRVDVWPLTRRLPQVFRGTPGKEILDVEFSPDGSWLASASADGTARVWSLNPGGDRKNRVLLETRGEFVEPTRVAVDPGGRFLATSTLGGEVRVLALDGTSDKLLSGFNGVLHSVAIGPNGRLVASGSGAFGFEEEAIVRVWDLQTGETRILDTGDAAVIRCVRFTTEGALVSASGSGAYLWNVDAGTHQRFRDDYVWDLALSKTGAVISVGVGGVRVHDLANETERRLTTHGVDVEAVAISTDGTRVATVESDGTIRVGPTTGEEPHLLIGHRGPVQGLAFSPDGRTLASAGNDGTIRLWPIPQGVPLHTRPRDELLDYLRGLTNLRAVADADSGSGYSIRADTFPGWQLREGAR